MTRVAKHPEGRIDMDSAAAMTGALDTDASHGDTIEVDLSAVTDVDSAALALLLEWQRRLGARGANLVLTGIPAGLTALIRLYGLEEILRQAGEPQA